MEQVRNFFRHAGQIGLLTAVLELLWTVVSSTRFHYDENGCLHSEGIFF